jgi:predicted membrane-bound spermidine synthase
LPSPPTISYSKWSGRFTWAAIIQGAIVALLTAMLAAFSVGMEYPRKLVEMMLAQPAIGFSEVTALAGLGLYLIVGVIGTGLTAQFYHHFEVRVGKPYVGSVANGLAWIHLVLMNLGVAAASMMMIYAGYLGDVAVSSRELGGFEMSIEQAAEQILNPFIAPVAAMLLVMVTGAVAGGAGFILNNSSSLVRRKCSNTAHNTSGDQ